MTGVIDVGSNSVRLIVRENGKTLYKNNIISQLALGMSGKLLSLNSINRTADAFLKLFEIAKSFGVKNIFAFGTAALRNADNGKDFCELVFNKTGVSVDIISGDKEATLGLKGVLKGNDGGIIDIGGASSELIVQKSKKTVYSYSLKEGAISLTNRFGDDRIKLEKYAHEVVKNYGKVPPFKAYGVGGTVTTLACVMQKLKEYDSRKVNGYVITRSKLKEFTDRFFFMSKSERENIRCLQKERAKVLGGGLILLSEITDFLGVDFITASDDDNLEGFLIDKGLYE